MRLQKIRFSCDLSSTTPRTSKTSSIGTVLSELRWNSGLWLHSVNPPNLHFPCQKLSVLNTAYVYGLILDREDGPEKIKMGPTENEGNFTGPNVERWARHIQSKISRPETGFRAISTAPVLESGYSDFDYYWWDFSCPFISLLFRFLPYTWKSRSVTKLLLGVCKKWFGDRTYFKPNWTKSIGLVRFGIVGKNYNWFV